jgi:hypothetical protein
MHICNTILHSFVCTTAIAHVPGHVRRASTLGNMYNTSCYRTLMRASLHVLCDAHAALTLLRTSRSNPRIFRPFPRAQSLELSIISLEFSMYRQIEKKCRYASAQDVCFPVTLFAHLLFRHVAPIVRVFLRSTNRHRQSRRPLLGCTTDHKRIHRII